MLIHANRLPDLSLRPLAARANPVPTEDFLIDSVPKSMEHQELRKLAAAHQASAHKTRVDIQTLPFGLELELEGVKPEEARKFVDQMPRWDVKPGLRRWVVTEDASLDSGCETVSPPMILRGGQADAQVRKILGYLQSRGARAEDTCGLHIHVDASCLDKQGLGRLTSLVLELESILFQLAQHGKPRHRGQSNDYQYCQPLTRALQDPFPMMHARDAREFREAVGGPGGQKDRYVSLNFESLEKHKTVEFRLFDATCDPQQVMDSVRLVLTLVKAAAEGQSTFLKPNPLGAKIPGESLDYFLDHLISDSRLRGRLKTSLVNSRGKIDPSTLEKDWYVLSAATLMREGFALQVANRPLFSPYEAARLVREPSGSGELKVIPPWKSAPCVVTTSQGWEQLVERSSSASWERFHRTADRLRKKGYSLRPTDERRGVRNDPYALFWSERLAVVHPEGLVSDKISSLKCLREALTRSSGLEVPSSEPGPTPFQREVVGLVSGGLGFYPMDAPRAGFLRRPAGPELTADKVSLSDGFRVRLPRWTWWNGLPRKHIVIQNSSQWSRLMQKLGPFSDQIA